MDGCSSMDFSCDGYYTSLLTQDAQDDYSCEDNLEGENEVPESSEMNGMNSQAKPKGRSENFSEDEDILLVSAYLNVKDAVTGRDKKDGRFWERAEKYFHENKTFESDRNWSSLKHIWGIIQKEVSVFQGYHDSIERKNESEKTSNDKLNVQRPPGRKAEKENVRGRKRGDCESDPFIEEVKKMREARQETERERKNCDERFFELEEKA